MLSDQYELICCHDSVFLIDPAAGYLNRFWLHRISKLNILASLNIERKSMRFLRKLPALRLVEHRFLLNLSRTSKALVELVHCYGHRGPEWNSSVRASTADSRG